MKGDAKQHVVSHGAYACGGVDKEREKGKKGTKTFGPRTSDRMHKGREEGKTLAGDQLRGHILDFEASRSLKPPRNLRT